MCESDEKNLVLAYPDNTTCCFAAPLRPIRDSNPCRRRERVESTPSFAGLLFTPERHGQILVNGWPPGDHCPEGVPMPPGALWRVRLAATRCRMRPRHGRNRLSSSSAHPFPRVRKSPLQDRSRGRREPHAHKQRAIHSPRWTRQHRRPRRRQRVTRPRTPRNTGGREVRSLRLPEQDRPARRRGLPARGQLRSRRGVRALARVSTITSDGRSAPRAGRRARARARSAGRRSCACPSGW